MKVFFDFVARQGLQVASALAEEIENKLQHPDRNFKVFSRPVLLSVKDSEFRFEGGTVINVELYNVGEEREDWVVYRAKARYYVYDPNWNRSEEKTVKVWEADNLVQLKETRHWYHPHVRSIDDIRGKIGIFWDNGTQTGFVQADPECVQDGFANLSESVSYRILVAGDKEQAIKKADEILRGYYASLE